MNEEEIQKDAARLIELIRQKFNETHTQQFSFSLDSHDIEITRLRAKVIDDSPDIGIQGVERGSKRDPPESAILDRKMITVGGKGIEAVFWDREAINRKGYTINGPAIITEMDANTLILPGCFGEVDEMGNILIWPLKESQGTSDKERNHSTKSAEEIVAEDPLISTLISSSLQSIRREMDTLMLRCAMSPAIRDQQDEFNVIANPKGQMLVGQFGSFIPSFLDLWKGSIDEGDVFV